MFTGDEGSGSRVFRVEGVRRAASMNGGVFRAPNLLLPTPFQIKIVCLQRDHFRVWMVFQFGEQFMAEVMRSPDPIVLPIVTYDEVWDLTVYILL